MLLTPSGASASESGGSLMIRHIGGFLAVSAMVIVIPGPDTALAIRNSLAGGRRAGICVGAGICTGQAIWALGTTAGLAGLLDPPSRPGVPARPKLAP